MNLGLQNKVALVTGSSRGIGRAIALGFAAEGAKVAVTGRTRSDVLATAAEIDLIAGKGSALPFVGDLRKESQVRKCVQSVSRHWGRLDALVANMGSGRGVRGWQADSKEWTRLLDLNLLGAAQAARAAVPHLAKGGNGSIVFVSSIAGLERLGAPLAYESAKAAVLALSKSLSKDLAAQGIRVNAVAPGNILFPGGTWEKHLQAAKAKVSGFIRSEVPLQRFGHPEEVAAAVLFLASSQASFITGSCLVVDGGQTRAHA